jgi:hypothetical protein
LDRAERNSYSFVLVVVFAVVSIPIVLDHQNFRGKRRGFSKAVGGTAVLFSDPPEGMKRNLTTRLSANLGAVARGGGILWGKGALDTLISGVFYVGRL